MILKEGKDSEKNNLSQMAVKIQLKTVKSKVKSHLQSTQHQKSLSNLFIKRHLHILNEQRTTRLHSYKDSKGSDHKLTLKEQ